MKTPVARNVIVSCLLAVFTACAQSTNDFPELNPPYAELPPTFWEQHGLSVAIGSLVCLIVIGFVGWVIFRPKPIPVLPPEVQARRALEALRAQPEDGALLSKVSQILKRYFIAAFRLPPGELTTSELVAAIGSSEAFTPELREAIGAFLQQCDGRKFATRAATESSRVVERALVLINQGEGRRVELSGNATKVNA